MSFTDTNIWSATKKLYRYKLKAQIGIFLSLMFIQCLGLLISFGFSKYYSTKDPEILISIKYYSGDAIFVFTLIGAFMAGMMVNPKSHRDTDFFFVANRLTSHLSNIAFLLTVSLYAGITVPLLGSVFKLIIYLTADHSLILSGDVVLSAEEYAIGMWATTMSVCLLSAIGYLWSIFIQLGNLFIIVLPVFFIGLLLMDLYHQSELIYSMFQFYAGETSLLVYSCKIIATLVVVYTSAVILTSRLEVGR